MSAVLCAARAAAAELRTLCAAGIHAAVTAVCVRVNVWPPPERPTGERCRVTVYSADAMRSIVEWPVSFTQRWFIGIAVSLHTL